MLAPDLNLLFLLTHSMSDPPLLEGVVALVCNRVDGDLHSHSAITSKLRQLGAKTTTRFGRDVTHVIFQRKLDATAVEKAAEDAELRTVYERMAKV